MRLRWGVVSDEKDFYFHWVVGFLVVDFHWNSIDPWTIVSMSDDCGSTTEGVTLQKLYHELNALDGFEDDYHQKMDELRSLNLPHKSYR
ncbi:hypothetical protein Dimus_033567 [Dionaea muscipula]